jgi:hypothetical protein
MTKLRSVNAHIEMVLRRALTDAGRPDAEGGPAAQARPAAGAGRAARVISSRSVP